MALRVAINGFGRIGRLIFRALIDKKMLNESIDIVAINDIAPADNLAYLLKYDSNQGKFKGNIDIKDKNKLVVNDKIIQCLNICKQPIELPWKKLKIDIVVESTGFFIEESQALGHLKAGAKKVIISAPGKGNIKTVVLGVNCKSLTVNDNIISNASCTTNCLAPIVKIMLENFGIEEGLMTTVHSYTSTQKSVDSPSKKDWKSGRAAAVNIIPSTTGAAKAVELVLPSVKGKLTGMSFRVPTSTVSVVDFTVRTKQSTTYSTICKVMEKASKTESLKGILAYTEDEVVSSDFIHDSHSSIFDAKAGIQLNNRFFKLISWYDNEWGYSNRCVELIEKVSNLIRN